MIKKLVEFLRDKTNYDDIRYKCPCCGYPTLDSEAGYDICTICNWEDDGQSEEDADEILGGPNGEYSLTQARDNFRKYMCMYEPGKDMRLTGGDTTEEIELKKELMLAYESIKDYTKLKNYKEEYKRVLDIEQKIFNISKRRIDEHCSSKDN